MGELFANMDKMDIQAERRKTAEAERRADAEGKRADAESKRADAAEKSAEEAYEKGIRSVIKTCKNLNASKESAVTQVLEMYARSLEEAEKLVECYWND